MNVERNRLVSFLRSAQTLQVHGLYDQTGPEFTKFMDNNGSFPEDTKKISQNVLAKKMKKSSSLLNKSVTATISPAFPAPLRPSSRNSPKAGPSNRGLDTAIVKSSDTPSPPIAVKMEEPSFSDEENHPEHVVIPSDPNSIGKSMYCSEREARATINGESIYELGPRQSLDSGHARSGDLLIRIGRALAKHV